MSELLTPLYQTVYGGGRRWPTPTTWAELLAVIRSRRHYGLALPVRVERVR